MSGAGLLHDRAPQIAARLVLALIAVALGCIAVMHSLAMVVQKRSLREAHALAPGNGLITGELSSELSGPKATGQGRVQADRLARLALRQDPTAIDAGAALGLNAQIRGNTQLARRLFAYVQALSRRDLPTQLWAIGDAIERNDLSAALTHYDIALRTSPDASSLLFPPLAMGTADPTIRAALARTLARQPAWANDFMGYVITNDTDPEAAASLFQMISHLHGTVPDQYSAGVINALIRAGKIDQAWAYYASLHPGASRRVSRDPTFESHTQAPSEFDWVPIGDGNISASIQPDGRHGGALIFAAPPSIGGLVARQIELLPSGDYILEGRSEGIDQSDDAKPYWSLSCNGGSELGRVDVPNSSVANGRFGGHITVPADCPVQVLALNIRPSSNVSGVTGQIDRALLRPVR
jgi:hypothetical protein